MIYWDKLEQTVVMQLLLHVILPLWPGRTLSMIQCRAECRAAWCPWKTWSGWENLTLRGLSPLEWASAFLLCPGVSH